MNEFIFIVLSVAMAFIVAFFISREKDDSFKIIRNQNYNETTIKKELKDILIVGEYAVLRKDFISLEPSEDGGAILKLKDREICFTPESSYFGVLQNLWGQL